MTNFNDIARTIVDQNNNSSWTGSVYALKDLLMFVNNNQDIEFAICRLDQDSLTFSQVAYQTWSVSMNIMEVW